MKALGLVVLAGCASWAWSQQTAEKLTARELFYSAVDTPVPAAHKPAKPAVKAKPVSRKSAPASETSAAENTPADPARNGAVPVVQAAYRPQGPRPALGLRYTILKKTGDEQVEVGTETVFHAGDRIRLAVETNDDGYFYVVNRGSSGTWKLLFPSAEIKGGDNRIQKRVRYEIPWGYTFTFDEQAGAWGIAAACPDGRGGAWRARRPGRRRRERNPSAQGGRTAGRAGLRYRGFAAHHCAERNL